MPKDPLPGLLPELALTGFDFKDFFRAIVQSDNESARGLSCCLLAENCSCAREGLKESKSCRIRHALVSRQDCSWLEEPWLHAALCEWLHTCSSGLDRTPAEWGAML